MATVTAAIRTLNAYVMLTTGETIVQLLPTIVIGVVALAGMFGLWKLVTTKLGDLFDFLAGKTRIDYLRNVDEILVGAFGDAYDDLVANDGGTAWLQKATADGKITPEEWGELKNRGVAKAKGLLDLQKLRGYVGDVDGYLLSRSGTAIAESKSRGKDVKKVETAADPS